MKQLLKKSLVIACVGIAQMLMVSWASAGVILAPTAVVDDNMGQYESLFAPFENMLNQTGLSANYVSGVTDFATFTSSGVTHSGGDSNSWLSSSGVLSGFVVFDLGAAYDVSNMVMWNGASGISASVSGFSLTASLTDDFAVSTLLGDFTGHQDNYGATVYDTVDVYARYVRMDIDGNFGNLCCTVIGDIAFDVAAGEPPVDAPEPAALGLLGLGLVGFGLARRRRN